MSEGATYRLVISASARRQLTDPLPEAAAFAAYEFIVGALLDNTQRVGKRLQPSLADRHSARRGTYRVIYRIDETKLTVTVVAVLARGDAYRTPKFIDTVHSAAERNPGAPPGSDPTNPGR